MAGQPGGARPTANERWPVMKDHSYNAAQGLLLVLAAAILICLGLILVDVHRIASWPGDVAARWEAAIEERSAP